MKLRFLLLRLFQLGLLLGLVSCAEPRAVTITPGATPAVATRVQQTATPQQAVVAEVTVESADVTPRPSPIPSATIGPTATLSGSACGQLLPIRLPPTSTHYDWVTPPIDNGLLPADAVPAVEYFFDHPEDVALVVYRVGYEGVGFYHNADQPMPLASLSKLLQLVGYGLAVDAGTLSPDQPVAAADLEAYYLPRSDLGAHNEALRDLDEDNLTLKDIVWMMIRHSANTAADYLHDLLGQRRLEELVVELGLGEHSAPCTFLGRFLAMAPPASLSNSDLDLYLADPRFYGEDLVRMSELYRNDSSYRAIIQSYWGQRGQPSVLVQREFVAEFETQGTAAGYAALMAGLVTGQIGSPTSNAAMRAELEWPYREFPSNQENYQVIGYKNGTLPGVLTTAYYAWPNWSDQPLVLVLFYRNIPTETYQQWRRDLPHDSFAHWLMSNPNAIHIMHVWRDTAAGGG